MSGTYHAGGVRGLLTKSLWRITIGEWLLGNERTLHVHAVHSVTASLTPIGYPSGIGVLSAVYCSLLHDGASLLEQPLLTHTVNPLV